jgi:hypothetical protein
MARVTLQQCQAWAEPTKLSLEKLDADLLSQIETEVLGRIASTYDIGTWIDEATTPSLVRTAVAKKYVAWFYERQYSENVSDSGSSYAQRLDANAEMIIMGLIDGTIELPGVNIGSGGEPVFYPTDQSSALDPTLADPSLGPARFSMGTVF